jgi:hypothetical protein
MPDYYVNNNAQSNGDHEVHISTCVYVPSNRRYLGNFSNCAEAVRHAKRIYSKSNGCKYCSPECHTT